jgi:transposase-like protein
MPRKRHTPEQVINKLRAAEVAISSGSTVAEACRQIGLLPLAQRIRWLEDRPGKASEAA